MKLNLKEIAYLFVNRLPRLFIGRFISHNLIRLHWGRNLNNFGDCLQPYIAKYYGLLPVYVSTKSKADIIMQGSILQLINSDYSGYILGTGGDDFKYSFPEANVIAVRGHLTKENIKESLNDAHNILLGDLGLLMAKVLPNIEEKKYELGIVLHFVDHNSLIEKNYRYNFMKNNVLFINVLKSPEIVIRQIKQCKNIISSSLHGLIIADSFGIPNIRIVNRNTMPTNFYDYKFEDYYSSLEVEADFIEVNGSESISYLIDRCKVRNPQKVKDLIAGLDSAMKNLATKFKK